MSDTEQLFLLAGIWTLIAVVFARFIPNWPGRIAFLAIAVGLPFWELPYGYYNLQELCRTQGALKVFEPIMPQESICVDYPFETAASSMLKRGFKKVESRDKKGGVVGHRNVKAADIESLVAERVTSEYCVTYSFVRGLPWRAMRNEFVVVRNSDQRLVARHSDFVWFGMWWQEAALPFFGRGGECRHDGIGSIAHLLLHGAK